jgi:hypothetical protein
VTEQESAKLLSEEQFMTLLQAIADAQVGIDTIDRRTEATLGNIDVPEWVNHAGSARRGFEGAVRQIRKEEQEPADPLDQIRAQASFASEIRKLGNARRAGSSGALTPGRARLLGLL